MDSTNEQRLPACLSLKRLALRAAPQGQARQLSSITGGSRADSDDDGPVYGSTATFPKYLQAQLHDQWCWAATAVSLGNMYQNPKYTFNQTSVATAVLGIALWRCTGSAYQQNEAACNQPHDLQDALKWVGALQYWVRGVPSREATQEEIRLSRPIAVRIAQNNGTPNGHFVVIPAYQIRTDDNTGDQTLWWYVCDPWAGGKKSWQFADTFPGNYPVDRNTTWAATYFTIKSTPDPASQSAG